MCATMDVLREVIRAYIDNDYPRHEPEAGHLFGLDDELGGGWGRSREEVLAEIEQTLGEWSTRLIAGREGYAHGHAADLADGVDRGG